MKEEEYGVVSISEYDRNRRETIEAGTREVSIIDSIPAGADSNKRLVWEAVLRQKVVEAYEERWGSIQGRSYEVRHINLTCQVMTVLRVWP